MCDYSHFTLHVCMLYDVHTTEIQDCLFQGYCKSQKKHLRLNMSLFRGGSECGNVKGVWCTVGKSFSMVIKMAFLIL